LKYKQGQKPQVLLHGLKYATFMTSYLSSVLASFTMTFDPALQFPPPVLFAISYNDS
jgi:hypothetical protein